MTNSSPIQSTVALKSINKGSTYGKVSNTPSPYSFQQSQRGNRSVLSNRVEVLSKEVTLYPLQSQSIIIAYDPTRDPTTALLAKLEYKFKLMFFLRDLGIKSAHEPADTIWKHYMYILGELASGTTDDL